MFADLFLIHPSSPEEFSLVGNLVRSRVDLFLCSGFNRRVVVCIHFSFKKITMAEGGFETDIVEWAEEFDKVKNSWFACILNHQTHDSLHEDLKICVMEILCGLLFFHDTEFHCVGHLMHSGSS